MSRPPSPSLQLGALPIGFCRSSHTISTMKLGSLQPVHFIVERISFLIEKADPGHSAC